VLPLKTSGFEVCKHKYILGVLLIVEVNRQHTVGPTRTRSKEIANGKGENKYVVGIVSSSTSIGLSR